MPYHNLLLIDDDVDDQEIFQLAVNKVSQSVKLTTFTNAEIALKKLDAGELHPNVIFLDLNMPIMTGQEFLFQIKKNERLKSIPIIIFSTSSHAPTIALAKQMGALDFITKPDSLEDLVDILQAIV